MTKKIYIDKTQIANQEDVDAKNAATEAELKKRPISVNGVKPDDDGNIALHTADAENVYTKAEVDAKDKANVKSATINGGDPIKPDDDGNLPLDLSKYAETEAVNSALANKADKSEADDLKGKVETNTQDISDLKNKKDIYHFTTQEDTDKFLASDEATDKIVVAEIPDTATPATPQAQPANK